MKHNKIKPPIGTANSGYEYKVEIEAPFGDALVTELKKIGDKNKAKKKVAAELGEGVNSTGKSTI